MIHGLLLLNKPSGMTSHDCVDRLRSLLSMRQIGHLGTLDPRAKGLLPMCLGLATKYSQFLPTEKKRYHFHIRLGIATDTQDMDGEIVQEKPVPTLEPALLEKMIEEFTSQPYLQETPGYSARKVKGKKLYQYARAGQEIPRLPPRPVTIHEMSLNIVNAVTLEGDVLCSTGTYVRQLAVDIGEKLGTTGVLFDLTRTSIESWDLTEAVDLQQLSSDLSTNPTLTDKAYFMPLSQLLGHYPQFRLGMEAWQRLERGLQPVYLYFDEVEPRGSTVPALKPGDRVCGLVPWKEQENVPGAVLSVQGVRDQRIMCRLQKLLVSSSSCVS